MIVRLQEEGPCQMAPRLCHACGFSQRRWIYRWVCLCLAGPARPTRCRWLAWGLPQSLLPPLQVIVLGLWWLEEEEQQVGAREAGGGLAGQRLRPDSLPTNCDRATPKAPPPLCNITCKKHRRQKKQQKHTHTSKQARDTKGSITRQIKHAENKDERRKQTDVRNPHRMIYLSPAATAGSVPGQNTQTQRPGPGARKTRRLI